MARSEKPTTLYPTGDAFVTGDPVYGDIPALITDADAATATALLAYSPPAFATAPTPFSEALEANGMPHTILNSPAPPAPSEPAPADAPVQQ